MAHGSDRSINAIALRGLDHRTSELLERQAWFEGTNYDHLFPWEPFYGPVSKDAEGNFAFSGHSHRHRHLQREFNNGPIKYRPKRIRKPGIQIGLVREKVDRIRQEITGDDKWATITPAAEAETFETLDVRQAMALPVQDVALKGSGVVGFLVKEDGTLESRYLETEWCDAIFINQVHQERARALAEEYRDMLPPAELVKLQLPPKPDTRRDPALPVPEVGDGLDLAHLRYQWRRDEEVMRDHHKETVITVFRRDYLPHVTIDYEPIVVNQGDQQVSGWKPVLPLEPHGFGVVPFVWMRPEGTAPGEMEGPATITRQFITVAKAADYAESFRHSAFEYNAFPRIHLHDVKLLDEFNASPEGRTNRNVPLGDPGVFLRTSTSGKSGSPGSVNLLETSGTAIRVGIEHSAKLRDHADRLSGLREFDQSEAAGAMSGVALERMAAPRIAVIQSFRKIVADAVQLLWQKALIALGKSGSPELDIVWPRPLELSAEDANAWATVYTALRAGGLITLETAVTRMLGLLGVQNIPDEITKLEAEAAALPPPPMPGGNEDDNDDGDGDDEEEDEE